MQQILADSSVCAHGEGQFAFGSNEPAGPLNNAMPQRIKSFEILCGRTFGASPRRSRSGQHLYFPGEVVSHHGTEGKDLVTGQSPGRDHVQSRMVFGIAKDGFLTAPSVVEHNYTFG